MQTPSAEEQEAPCLPVGRGRNIQVGFKSQLCHLDAVWLWTSHLALLILCFLTLKMEISPLQGCYKD